jgi:hypothetical protein
MHCSCSLSRKMVVSLPCRCGGRGDHGRGRGGPPFRDREHDPRLVSNSSNTTLAASVSRLPPAPGQPAIASLLLLPALMLPPPPPSPAVVIYTDAVAALAIGSEPGPFSGRTSADAAAKLTQSALMISILAKNHSSKNNSAYSKDADKGMRIQIAPLERQILVTVQMERPSLYVAMQILLKLPDMARTVKWSHIEALVKIWEIFREIPSLVDGSFVGHFTRHSCDLKNDLDTYNGVMTNVEQLADEELGRKIDSVRSIKSLPFLVGEKERNYMSPCLAVNRAEFPHCAACGHRFIDHPPSNEVAHSLNAKMQQVYMESMAAITEWRANKKTLLQPVCPKTGKLLNKISLLELIKKHIRCHCLQLRENWCTGAQCPNGCSGYEKGKCPVCQCTCSLYVTEEQHREICILASLAKDGAAEMDLADDAWKFLLDSLGVGAMQCHVSAEKYHKVAADGGMQVQQGGGVPFLSNIVNEGDMAQVLCIVNNPTSQQAASILCSKVDGVAHPSSRTCINLCGETVDLRTYGKSTSSNAARK